MTTNSQNNLVDHLFRHQYGKMVAILSKIFGLSHLDLVEDAIQDTFLQASLKWRTGIPDSPEAWLTQAAKNRVIDLMRQVNARTERHDKVVHGSVALEIDELFLDHEVADGQLRMIFLACHPIFSREEQIAFALKCISGFSLREIAAALMQKEETIKKRIARAKKKINEHHLKLEYPSPREVPDRIAGVLQVIYLIFNEGFHSTKENDLVNEELCGEAIRLCKQLLINESFRSGSVYALFALLCYHAARLPSKTVDGSIVDLEEQDRSQWYAPLINLGHDAFNTALVYADHSVYLHEAAIAREHVMAASFSDTKWANIIMLYKRMYEQIPSASILLSMASAYIYMGQLDEARQTLERIDPEALNKRQYLYYGTSAKIFEKKGLPAQAMQQLKLAISSCSNNLEKVYLEKQLARLEKNSQGNSIGNNGC